MIAKRAFTVYRLASMTARDLTRKKRYYAVAGIPLFAFAACLAGSPLEGSQKVLIGRWISPSGAELIIRPDGSCDYKSKAENVEDGTLIVLPKGNGGTLRCRTFLGGVSLQVDRWPVNDYRGKVPRTYITLSGVEYTKRAAKVPGAGTGSKPARDKDPMKKKGK